MSTPPPPNTQAIKDQLHDASTDQFAMPSPTKSLPLTLILAATPSLGIGHANALPWPQLRKEMAYFARVTKRVSAPPAVTATASGTIADTRRVVNAVVMGRKTWDSIPEKFRPLKGRVNVVVTRGVGDEKWSALQRSEEGPVVVGSVGEAVESLSSGGFNAQILASSQLGIEKVFVIGGASIYKAALEGPEARRVLLTKIGKEFECDTFFPVDLEKDEGWRRGSKDELERVVGEEVPGEMEEKGVTFEFCLFERYESDIFSDYRASYRWMRLKND
ncbi:hypothetical protein P154DRAFT_618486 [Amniculicola lignicola CBS 123094]|uniref:Dihydrofolate reductase n=1 Tax=Amniculicola lignicola CBS 123094 TaxID=1392246 RepID=A0A6A5WXL7_9PLEO|nr:hypothetical protein P154DRAFT_618486 [Amniculicola lignicola CBS 123094]